MRPVVTAAEMNVSLAKHFAHPNYGIVFEVARCTGFNANRHIDAMAMGLWPSRGLELVAIEVKGSRSDFRRELKQPEKAEELAQFCDRFYIAAPEGLVAISELPPNWGLLERRETGAMMETKPALRLEPKPVTRNLLAAVFRAASRPISQAEIAAAVEAERKAGEQRLEDAVQLRLKHHHQRDHDDAEKWRSVCAALGEHNWMDDERLVRAVKLVNSMRLAEDDGLQTIRDRVATKLERIDSALATERTSP